MFWKSLSKKRGRACYKKRKNIISKLIKSGDYRYNDIAVIAGDIESYHKYIEQAFEKYDDISVIKGNRLSGKSKVNGRKPLRNITSIGLDLLIKSIFFVKVSDTMEGFQFFRKDCIDRLIKMSSDDNGWFYCAELLIRAEKAGYRIAELPVVWNDDYDTKVNVIKLIKNYLCRIVELKLSFGREKLKWIL